MSSDYILALERLHGKGVLHCDISLRNILLSDEENELGEREGLVIDLDYAIENEKHSKAAACHRTVSFFFPLQVLAPLLRPYLGYVPVHGHRTA